MSETTTSTVERLQAEVAAAGAAVAAAPDPWEAAARVVAVTEATPLLTGALGTIGATLAEILGVLPTASEDANQRRTRARAGLRLAEMLLVAGNPTLAGDGLAILDTDALNAAERVRFHLAYAEVLIAAGDADASMAALREADDRLSSDEELRRDPMLVARYAMGAGALAFAAGQMEDAEHLFLLVDEQTEAAGAVGAALHVGADMTLARIALATDRPAESVVFAQRAGVTADAWEARMESLLAHRLAAEAALAAGQPKVAIDEVFAATAVELPEAAHAVLPGLTLALGRAFLSINDIVRARAALLDVADDTGAMPDERGFADLLIAGIDTENGDAAAAAKRLAALRHEPLPDELQGAISHAIDGLRSAWPAEVEEAVAAEADRRAKAQLDADGGVTS